MLGSNEIVASMLRYCIDENFQNCGEDCSNLTFFFQISVRKQDGSCVTFTDPNKKKITFIREQFYTNVDESTKTETVHDLDDDGNLFLTLDIAKNESSFSVKVFDHQILANSFYFKY